jgi:hypothetical protein
LQPLTNSSVSPASSARTIPLKVFDPVITEGSRDILFTLLKAFLFVILVVFSFAISAVSSDSPACCTGVLIGAFVVFPLHGFSINGLSLFGLVLAIVLVVHDVIVMVKAASTAHRENKPNRSCRKEVGDTMTTIVGVFDDFTAALTAIPALVEVGVDGHSISTVAQDNKGEYAKFLQAETLPAGHSHVGVGATVGGISGLLLGLAALAMPGIGPVIAAGTLVAAIAGTTLGAATGGLLGALNGMGVPDFEAKAYDQGVREGSTLLIVQTAPELVSRVSALLQEHHAVRVDQH